MKTIISILIFLPLYIFSQKSDLTRQQAFEVFKKSENRKMTGIKTSEFSLIWKQANCIKKEWEIDFKDMPIFKLKNDGTFVEDSKFRQSLFGLGDTLFFETDDDGKKTETCGAFPTLKN